MNSKEPLQRLESMAAEGPEKSAEARWRDALEMVATHISEAFKVTLTEIAILVRTKDGQTLRFVYPPALAVGPNAFPLRVWSVAGNVLKSGTAFLDNSFAETKHLSFYEHVNLGGSKSGIIQKIMVVPLPSRVDNFGVVEVSRKGSNPDEAGPDFTSSELQRLANIVKTVAPYLEGLKPITL